jgi:hypothetical protein
MRASFDTAMRYAAASLFVIAGGDTMPVLVDGRGGSAEAAGVESGSALASGSPTINAGRA